MAPKRWLQTWLTIKTSLLNPDFVQWHDEKVTRKKNSSKLIIDNLVFEKFNPSLKE